MAKGNIVLDVDTKYNGEGMTKLNQAMKDTGAKAKTASRAIGSIQQALGETNTAAGKVAGAVGGIVQSFTQLGIAGGIIAAGTLAIQGLFKWLNRTNDALAEMAKNFGNRVASAVKIANAEIAKTNKMFAEMLGKKNTKTERENIVADAGLSQMEEQKKQDLVGKSGAEAAKIELEWTKKIEDYKEAQAKKHLKDVKEEIALTQQNLKAQQDAQAKAYSKFKTLNSLAVDAWNNDKLDVVTKNKWSDDAQVAKKEWQAYTQPIEELQKKLESLGTKELKAEQDSSLAPQKRQTALMQAEQKLQDALEAEAKEREDATKRLKDELQDISKKQTEKIAKHKQPQKEDEIKPKVEVEPQVDVKQPKPQAIEPKVDVKQPKPQVVEPTVKVNPKLSVNEAKSNALSKEIAKTEASLKEWQAAQNEAFEQFKTATEKAIKTVNDTKAGKAEKTKAEAEANEAGKKLKELDKPIDELQKKLDQLKEQKLRADANAEIEKVTEEYARVQEELNQKLVDARRAVQDWISNLTSGAGKKFGDWNKQQNQGEKGKVQVMGADGKPVMGADGKPVVIDKKQANAAKSNKQLLDRITNRYDKDGDGKLSEDEMKKMDGRSRKEYERRLAFDEQFNPEKITEKQDAIQDIINQQLQAQIDMNTNLQKIQDKLVNLGL